MSKSGAEVATYKNSKTMIKRQLNKLIPAEIDFVPEFDQKQPQLVFQYTKARESIEIVKKQSDKREQYCRNSIEMLC